MRSTAHRCRPAPATASWTRCWTAEPGIPVTLCTVYMEVGARRRDVAGRESSCNSRTSGGRFLHNAIAHRVRPAERHYRRRFRCRRRRGFGDRPRVDGNVVLAHRGENGEYTVEDIAVDLDRKVSSAGTSFRTVVHAADFNVDGRLDLAVSNTFSREVAILLNDGVTLTPRHRVLIANSIVSIATVDLNADGRLDLIAANDDSQTAGVAVRLGRGNGSFQQDARLQVGTDPHALAAADFNSDGYSDLVSTSFNGLTIQLGAGDGVSPRRSPSRGISRRRSSQGTSIAMAARTWPPRSHSRAPIAQVDHRLGVWLGLGDGTFRDATYYNVGELPLDLVAADFNGDGALDLASTNGISNNVSVLLNAGDGTFALAATLAAGKNRHQSSPPILTPTAKSISQPRMSRAIAFPCGEASGTGDSALTTLATGDAPIDLLAADLDGDGRTDLVTADHGSGSLSLFYQGWNGASRHNRSPWAKAQKLSDPCRHEQRAGPAGGDAQRTRSARSAHFDCRTAMEPHRRICHRAHADRRNCPGRQSGSACRPGRAERLHQRCYSSAGEWRRFPSCIRAGRLSDAVDAYVCRFERRRNARCVGRPAIGRSPVLHLGPPRHAWYVRSARL